MAFGGGVNGSNGASGGGNNETGTRAPAKYSDFIKLWAKKDANLVTMIYDKLTELVKLAKENKQRSRSHSFPVMNREKRQVCLKNLIFDLIIQQLSVVDQVIAKCLPGDRIYISLPSPSKLSTGFPRKVED